MKKLFFLALVATLAVSLQAQTVVNSYVRMRHCFPLSSDTTVTAKCGVFNWNGQNYTSSGDYQFQTTNARGCDSTATLHLTVEDHRTTGTPVNDNICKGKTYVYKDSTYTTAGTHYYYAENTAGCTETTTITLTETECAPTGAINGLFSVAEGQQVWFAQGNLKYINDRVNKSTYHDVYFSCNTSYNKEGLLENGGVGTYRFHPNQWDQIFTSDQSSSINPQDSTDYLPHGASGLDWSSQHPLSSGSSKWQEPFNTSSNYTMNLYGSNEGLMHDVGRFNAIENGGNVPNIWRLLTKAEWDYLLARKDANDVLLYTYGIVHGKNGMILLPDNWTWTGKNPSVLAAAIDNKVWYWKTATEYVMHDTYVENTFTDAQWAAYEAAGAVFLPCAGYYYGQQQGIHDVAIEGRYMTASVSSSKPIIVNFGTFSTETLVGTLSYTPTGNVRLVQDKK